MNRKSKSITLTMLAGTAIVLTGCLEDEEPKLVKTVAECVEEFDDPEGCNEAAVQAVNEFEKTSPKFDKQQACEAQFGKDQCRQVSGGDGGSFFMPFMAGYFMSNLFNNGQRQYAVQPACNNGGSVYSGGCGTVNGARPGYTPTALLAGRQSGGIYTANPGFTSSWTSSKVAASRVSPGPSVVSRGGFGATGAAHTVGG